MNDRTFFLEKRKTENRIIDLQITIDELRKDLDAAQARIAQLESEPTMSPIQVDGINALVWRLEQGDDNGSVSREALAEFLRGLVKDNE